ncbi:hypothetical protein CDAR_540371 [Caerostris darwini]|uniref:Uncharacterized protein n=1 Tax=Caerostris darwini TaxID=1538125 RepID=A0AAV4WRU3_9ARAC|nr:hypothetical protein CDAR_540371 [Caerostris darwini]
MEMIFSKLSIYSVITSKHPFSKNSLLRTNFNSRRLNHSTWQWTILGMNPTTFEKGYPVMERGTPKLGTNEPCSRSLVTQSIRQQLQKTSSPPKLPFENNLQLQQTQPLNLQAVYSGNEPSNFHKGAPSNRKGGLRSSKRINRVGPSEADTNAVDRS